MAKKQTPTATPTATPTPATATPATATPATPATPPATAPTAPTATEKTLASVAEAGEQGQRAASAVTAAVKALFSDGIRASHLGMVDGKPTIPTVYTPVLGALWRGIEAASAGLADVRARVAAGVTINDGEKLWLDSSARIARATMGRIVSGLIRAASDADTVAAGKTAASATASEEEKSKADEALWVAYYATLHDGMKRVLEKAQGERTYAPLIKALREAAAEVTRHEGDHMAIRAAARAKLPK